MQVCAARARVSRSVAVRTPAAPWGPRACARVLALCCRLSVVVGACARGRACAGLSEAGSVRPRGRGCGWMHLL